MGWGGGGGRGAGCGGLHISTGPSAPRAGQVALQPQPLGKQQNASDALKRRPSEATSSPEIKLGISISGAANPRDESGGSYVIQGQSGRNKCSLVALLTRLENLETGEAGKVVMRTRGNIFASLCQHQLR